MTAAIDMARYTVRGGEPIDVPEKPADDWQASVRIIWDLAKKKAHETGADEHEGVAGAVYEGPMSRLVPIVWPTLSRRELDKASSRIVSELTRHGMAKCIDQGNRSYKDHRDPLWFVADEAGRLNKDRAVDGESTIAKEIVDHLAKLTRKVDAIEFAMEYGKQNDDLDTSSPIKIARWLARAGVKVNEAHVSVIRRRWLAEEELQRKDEALDEALNPEPDDMAERRVAATNAVANAVQEGLAQEREEVMHAVENAVVPVDEPDIEEEFVVDHVSRDTHRTVPRWEASMQQRMADLENENRELKRKLALARGMIGMALN
jgi:hypothetical protein